MKKNTAFYLIIIFSVLIGIGFSKLLYYNYTSLIEMNPIHYVENNSAVLCKIEKIQDLANVVVIDGWAIKSGEDIRTVKTFLVLKRKNSQNYYKVPTVKVNRSDITKLRRAQYDDSHVYNYCGFKAIIHKQQAIRLGKGIYEILILYMNNSHRILKGTGETIEI
jgi:hypothetical protein